VTLRAPMGRVPPGALAARLGRWRRIDLRRVLTGDLPLKIAAIGVALLLWVSAMRALPPPEVTAAFDGRVAVERPEVPEGYVLRADLGDVGVMLRGPDPVLAGLRVEQLRATLDLEEVIPGPEEQPAPVRVEVADERVAVVSVEPATIAVRLERRTERVLPVQARFANSPPGGFQAGTLTFRPSEVAVSGPESLVGRVTAVLATVRFGDAVVDLSQDVRPVPVDAGGEPVEGVEVDPAGVNISVPLVSTATTRTVPVTPRLRGDPATGYWVARVSVDPIVVTVSGERALVEPIDRVDTEPIEIGGLAADRTFTVALARPEGITIVGPTEITIRVSVVTLVGTRPFPLVAVRVVGLREGLTAETSPETTSVVLGGAVPTLSSLGAGSVVATVDVSGRGPGTYTLPVAIVPPGGTSVESLQPSQVTVTIRSTSAPPGP
jgi:YbbR domain-containing protein